ncbi:MAG: ABC transporter ATP-binding protein [Actinomycetota bacterium]|nr:ABC transporter ATP-binding protein [Actinomycetota bacterium]
MSDPLLNVEDLQVEFRTEEGVVRAVDGMTYGLRKGEVLAVLGESGSGKTVHARSILRILDSPPAYVTGGHVSLDDIELFDLEEADMQEIRGARIAMLFQDPHTALDPVYTVGGQMIELLQLRRGVSRREARNEAVSLLARVGIPSPEARLKAYPHQLSGGIAQRVMVAMAIALGPDVLLADEPTSSLDVTVQAQILELLRSIVAESEMAMVLITHNLAVAVGLADRIAVMYAGQLVEIGRARDVYAKPAHPYTAALLRSIPDINVREERLPAIKGAPPNLLHLPPGCPFTPRCPYATEICFEQMPPLEPVSEGHASACWHAAEVQR